MDTADDSQADYSWPLMILKTIIGQIPIIISQKILDVSIYTSVSYETYAWKILTTLFLWNTSWEFIILKPSIKINIFSH